MNRYLYSISLVCVLIFSALAAAAQSGDALVSARIDASHITVGDPAYLFLEVKHYTSRSAVKWASLPDTFSKLEITGRGKIDTLRAGEVTTYRQRLVVTGFDSGMFTIPRISFTITPTAGSAYLLKTDSLSLLVQTVAVDTTKAFRPIKGIITVAYSWRDYLPWIIGGFLLLVLAIGAIIYFIRRERNKVPDTVVIPEEPLHVKALRLLNALETAQLWQKGQVKEYYVQLTDILRSYIEVRYQTAALELTTDELMNQVKLTPGLLSHATQLEQILRTADLAKFAKAQPLPHEHLESMDLAKALIAASIPPAVSPNQSAPKA